MMRSLSLSVTYPLVLHTRKSKDSFAVNTHTQTRGQKHITLFPMFFSINPSYILHNMRDEGKGERNINTIKTIMMLRTISLLTKTEWRTLRPKDGDGRLRSTWKHRREREREREDDNTKERERERKEDNTEERKRVVKNEMRDIREDSSRWLYRKSH